MRSWAPLPMRDRIDPPSYNRIPESPEQKEESEKKARQAERDRIIGDWENRLREGFPFLDAFMRDRMAPSWSRGLDDYLQGVRLRRMSKRLVSIEDSGELESMRD
jgi:hypothetical protein